MAHSLRLADIGNTRAHLLEAGKLTHISPGELLERYKAIPLDYICVNATIQERVGQLPLPWRDISGYMNLPGSYSGMGYDRMAACIGVHHGVVVDAGSAVTLDVMRKGVYQGGSISPGIGAQLEALGEISRRLRLAPNQTLALDHLPKNSIDAITYGILKPLVAMITTHASGLPLTLCGGDAAWLQRYFPDAVLDEMIIFKGMKKVLDQMKESKK